ncbi:MAG: signal peptidase I [bacterium]|nr:signal peptidase I [bacterium]
MTFMNRFAPFWEILKVVVIVFVSAIIIRGFVAQPFIVEGSSMEPDFHNGEYLLVEKLGYHLRQPARGDVIVFKYPNDPSINYIKRIIGLPGETVRVFENQVFVNGKILTEQYLSPDERTIVSQNPEAPYEVALNGDQFFVMGDNRQHSSDSREWGPLGRDFIIGKSAFVLYPRQNFAAIASPSY